MAAWLQISGGERVPLTGACSIGRSLSNQLTLSSDKVSRRHAIIHAQENGEFWLVDLGSVNGTALNGRRVTQPVRLRDADQIEISHFRIAFHQEASSTDIFESRSDSNITIHELKTFNCWLLVADIEGSTQLLHAYKPEELAGITGRWLAECKQIVEESGGSINKFLGDGFFAYWRDRDRVAANVARALEALKRLQSVKQPRFRIAVHYGLVCAGGGASLGEESLSGRDVNFLFRMEKLAGALGHECLASEPAAAPLMAFFPLHATTNQALPGFDGEFPFFSF